MVKQISSNEEMRKMSFRELKKHVRELEKAGYLISRSDYKKLDDTSEDKRKLRKKIRDAYKKGVSRRSSESSSSSSSFSKSSS